MMMEATAMTSADPVDITAIRMRKSIAYSPVEPSSFWATRGAARPVRKCNIESIIYFTSEFNLDFPLATSSSESKGAPCALLNPR